MYKNRKLNPCQIVADCGSMTSAGVVDHCGMEK
jgi:hypothetical protein